LPRPRRRSISREILVIRRSLATIEKAFSRLGPLLSQGPVPGAGAPVARRKLRLTPARKSALVLQGQYMGHLRGLNARQKSQVKATRASKGIRAAIRLARDLGRS